MSILQDNRLRSVRWKDLTHLSFKEILVENSITLPWLIISCTLAYFHHYLVALPFSFLFFLTGLRQVHNGFHYTLGISRKWTWVNLFLNSLLMITAMHAVKYNHLRHHKYCMQKEDVEGNCARMKPVKALLYGPVFIFRLHATALRSKNVYARSSIYAELTGIIIVVFFVWLYKVSFLQYHILAMATGELFTAFFAVWTVHHDCDEEVFARTLSKPWKNRLTYNMFYHLEHHLFPGVPTIKLPELSARIKKDLPDIRVKEVF